MSISQSNSEEAISIINRYFEATGPVLPNILSINSIKWDANKLNESEAVLSDKMLTAIHLDLILEGGASAVTEYHKALAKGRNIVLEKARKILDNPKKIDESLAEFKKILKKKRAQLINEDLAAPATAASPVALANMQFSDIQKSLASAFNKISPSQNAAIPGTAATPGADILGNTSKEIDTALAGGEYKPGQGGIWGTLENFVSAITEGGSAIGILHLVLDIVGVIGDFILPGLGAAADIINGIIYFIRKKWMLGTISLISGFLIGSGDIFKLLKGSAAPAEKVMLKTIEGTGKGAAELAKIPAKEQGGVIKLLRYIAENIGGVFKTASQMLGKFFGGFIAKIVGWFPIVGKPLSIFFENVGKFFGRYGEKMTTFSGGFAKVEKEALEIAAKQADDTLEAFYKSEGKMLADPKTGMVVCTDASGKVIGEFSSELLTNPKVLNKKYPNLFKVGEKESIIAYYNSVAKANAKITAGTAESLSKIFKSASVNAIKRMPFFIGKMVLKIITGDEPMKAGIKKEEVEYWGNSALQTWINDRIKKEKEATGATYLPKLDLDSSDKEVFDHITNYQNNYAQLFGQPYIIPVVYDKYKNDEVEEDFKDMWKELGKERNAEFEKLKADADSKNKKETNESVSLKHIIPFSRFVS